MKNKSILYIVQAGFIAALYIVLSYLSSVLNLAFGPVQFRFSEALTILPVFTPAAIPGLVIGCLFTNLTSPYGIIDILIGTSATLFAALATRALRNVQIKNIPFLAPMAPVLFNAFFVSFSICIFTLKTFSMPFFASTALSIGAGQLVMCYGVGLVLYLFFNKSNIRKKLFPDI